MGSLAWIWASIVGAR